jgi:hypothetical protein
MSERSEWEVLHFAQSIVTSHGSRDVSRLLRRVAKTVDSLGPVDVFDITFYSHVTGQGEELNMTVYYGKIE